jgi:hypothetical protein
MKPKSSHTKRRTTTITTTTTKIRKTQEKRQPSESNPEMT